MLREYTLTLCLKVTDQDSDNGASLLLAAAAEACNDMGPEYHVNVDDLTYTVDVQDLCPVTCPRFGVASCVVHR